MKNVFFVLIVLLLNGCNNREDKRLILPESVSQKEGADGEILFKSNCANCHKPDKDFTAPTLRGVYERWEDKKLLFEYVRNSNKISFENKYVKDLRKKWNNLLMPSFTLTDGEIKSILNYCHNEDPPQK